MEQLDWQSLDLNNIPKAPGVYGWKWRGKWYYIGESTNLAKRLTGGHAKFYIAKSLSDAEFFWIPTCDHRRIEIQQKRLHKPEWQAVQDGENYFGNAPQCLTERSPYNVTKFDAIDWKFDGEVITVQLNRLEVETLDRVCEIESVSRCEAIKLLLNRWKPECAQEKH